MARTGSASWSPSWSRSGCAREVAVGRSRSSGPTSAMCCSRPSTGRPPCAARRCASCGSSLFVGSIVGAIGGVLAAHRFPDRARRGPPCGALFGLTHRGTRLRRCADRVERDSCRRGSARWSAVGLVAWPRRRRRWPPAARPAPCSAASRCGRCSSTRSVDPDRRRRRAASRSGCTLVGDVSVEAAERRSTLVGQLRFAATLQDIRTVIVLRRQLAMELPRLQPWIRAPGAGARTGSRSGRAACAGSSVGRRRGWRGSSCSGPSPGFAARGRVVGHARRSSSSPGLALFIAALDAVEPLAQEIDHPSRRDACRWTTAGSSCATSPWRCS